MITLDGWCLFELKAFGQVAGAQNDHSVGRVVREVGRGTKIFDLV